MLCDGTIVFLGRTDDQVKMRGIRFQLHKVENALRRQPEVKMAAVVVGTASAQLVGFLTPREIELEPLFKFLQGSLPSYMVPSAIVTLDKLYTAEERKESRSKSPAADDCITKIQGGRGDGCQERRGHSKRKLWFN